MNDNLHDDEGKVCGGCGESDESHVNFRDNINFKNLNFQVFFNKRKGFELVSPTLLLTTTRISLRCALVGKFQQKSRRERKISPAEKCFKAKLMKKNYLKKSTIMIQSRVRWQRKANRKSARQEEDRDNFSEV